MPEPTGLNPKVIFEFGWTCFMPWQTYPFYPVTLFHKFNMEDADMKELVATRAELMAEIFPTAN